MQFAMSVEVADWYIRAELGTKTDDDQAKNVEERHSATGLVFTLARRISDLQASCS